MTIRSTPRAGVVAHDGLEIPIKVGDRVMVVSYGYNVRLNDVHRTGEVVGFGGVRPAVKWDSDTDPIRGNVRSSMLQVLRRDGKPGFEGNVGR